MSAGVATAQAMDIVKPGEQAERMQVEERSEVQGDLYARLKTLQRQLEFLEIQVTERRSCDLPKQ
jgi:hypothetical protein